MSLVNDKYNDELLNIVDYVNKSFDLDILTKRRKAKDVRGRTLYFKLALKTTKASYETIGSMVNRDHSTVCHAIKNLFLEMEYFPRYVIAYDNYIESLKVDGLNANKSLKNINKAFERIDELKLDIRSLKRVISQMKKDSKKTKSSLLTPNEVHYRELSEEEASVYDQRAKNVLNSFIWKRKELNRKEVFEIINVS